MSTTPIVECVPNFSEGRDAAAIEAIAGAVRATEGAALLDVDPGKATNRTVVTFVGSPDSAVEAAFRAIATAAERIDMRGHKGEHPRIGATDVCPFVPVRGIDLEGCAELAGRLGERVGHELGIPVYLYEAAASRPERKNLADIRAGEYEGLPAKLASPEWAPDFGPSAWSDRVARTGATVIGARPFLIAWNVNLNTRDRRRAMRLAARIREKGMARRNERGEVVRGPDGEPVRDPGMFESVKAIGWYIEEYDRCQISINFTDWRVAAPHDVVDAVRRLADDEGMVVTGCELVGLIPMDAMLAAGRHYLRRQGACAGASENELVETAVRSLGLRDLGPFDPDQRIVERRIARDGPLVSATVRGFADRLSSSAPAPGGGSVASLCGALSAALSAMVGALTVGRKGSEDAWTAQDDNAVRAQSLKDGFLSDVDLDTRAFDRVMAARAMPKTTPEERAARDRAIEEATRAAAEVPLRVLQRASEAALCAEAATRGNPSCRSDAGVAALTALACAEGAWMNVAINLGGIADPAVRSDLRTRADAALEDVRARAGAVARRVHDELAAG